MGLSFTKSFGEDDLHQSHKLLDRLDKITADSVHHFAKNFLSAETVPDFQDIQIETCNRCNNDCPFCPANRNNDTRKPRFMDEELFYSIIDQLYAMDYHGTISLFSNNEPLLDGRILKFVEYARKRLPNAIHYLYTNGILLNAEKFSALVKNLDVLIIDNYDDNFQLIPSVEKTLSTAPAPYDISSAKVVPGLAAYARLSDSECDVRVDLRKKNQLLSLLANNSPNRRDEQNKFRPTSPCIYPFKQMIVRPDGTTAKCCNDPLTDMVTGDLNTHTVREVWRGRAYQDFRKEIFFNGRKNLKGCEFCDTFGLAMYIPSLQTAAAEFKRLADEMTRRKNLGAIYIFDTTQQSKQLFIKFKLFGVNFDGLVNVRDEPCDENYPCADLQSVVAERAFILIPTPHYADDIFDFLQAAGYQYRRDWLIYTYDIN